MQVSTLGWAQRRKLNEGYTNIYSTGIFVCPYTGNNFNGKYKCSALEEMKNKKTNVSEKLVEKLVKQSINDYKHTLSKLEEYDKGKIKKPRKSVKEYLPTIKVLEK